MKGSIGIDIVNVSRFRDLEKVDYVHRQEKLFSRQEIEYCRSFKESTVHFAGLFAAKEAVSKALGVSKYPFAEIEIRHSLDGEPQAWRHGKKMSVKISISHTRTVAVGVALS